jgi:hypothetical protein
MRDVGGGVETAKDQQRDGSPTEGGSFRRLALRVAAKVKRRLVFASVLILGASLVGCGPSGSPAKRLSSVNNHAPSGSTPPDSGAGPVPLDQENRTQPDKTVPGDCRIVTVWLPVGSYPEDSLTRKHPNDAAILVITPPPSGQTALCSEWEYKYGEPPLPKASKDRRIPVARAKRNEGSEATSDKPSSP